MPFQDSKKPATMDRVVCLFEIYKDFVDRDLVDPGELLEKLCLDDGCSGASFGAKAMEGVVDAELTCSSTMDATSFHRTSRRLIPQMPPSSLGRRTMTAQVICVGSSPVRKTCWTSVTTLSQCKRSGSCSLVASLSHFLRWSAHIPDGPGALL